MSKKACDGILRRADVRGKALPEVLKEALEQANEFIFESENTSYFNQQRVGEYVDGKGNSSTLMARDYKSPTDLICGHTSTQFAQYSEGVGTLRSTGGDAGGGSETLVVHGTQDPCVSKDRAFTVGRNNGTENCVAIPGNVIGRSDNTGGNGNGFDASGVCYTLTTADRHAVAYNLTVRRLTPVECERLQGFPDNWTQIPYKNKEAKDCPDGPRYKAMGNSMAVPVMRWIGERLQDYIDYMEVL